MYDYAIPEELINMALNVSEYEIIELVIRNKLLRLFVVPIGDTISFNVDSRWGDFTYMTVLGRVHLATHDVDRVRLFLDNSDIPEPVRVSWAKRLIEDKWPIQFGSEEDDVHDTGASAPESGTDRGVEMSQGSGPSDMEAVGSEPSEKGQAPLTRASAIGLLLSTGLTPSEFDRLSQGSTPSEKGSGPSDETD